MSKKLEQVLECLINEESDRASELLHDVIVEKARTLYQELVNEEDEMEEEVCEDEAVEESLVAEDDEEEMFGGDMADDFEGDIEADMEDDEGEFDMEDDMEDEGEEEDVEDRVEDLEAALADLRAEFDALMDEELEEPHHDAEDFEPEMEESMMEATKLQDKVSDPSNVEGADSKEAPYTKAPSKRLDGADPVDFAGGDEKGEKASQGSDHTPSDNIDEEPKANPAQKQSDSADEKDSLFSKEVK